MLLRTDNSQIRKQALGAPEGSAKLILPVTKMLSFCAVVMPPPYIRSNPEFKTFFFSVIEFLT